MADYTCMIILSCLIVALFFDRWYPLTFGGWFGVDIDTHWYLPHIVYVGKVLAFLFFFIWVRFTLPRFRYDQVMNLGWKVLFPIAILNLIVISIAILVMQHYGYMA